MTDLQSTFAAAAGGRERLAQNYSARTFGDLDKRADREIADAAATAEEAFAAIDRAARRRRFDDAAALEQLKAEWLASYRGKWAAFQAAGSRVLNWMITGPARFPVRSNQKRMDTEHRRLEEMLAFSKGAAAWAEKRIKRQVRAELGPVGVADQELDQARAKLAAREHRQAMMIAANKAVRKHKGDAASIRAELEAAGFKEAATLASAMSKGGLLHVGFERYQLSNNGAEIRRMQTRVAVLERRAAAVNQAAELEPIDQAADVDQVRIVENALEQRVQILFPGKPSSSVRDQLKRRGFRWSPRAGAWQRQLTANGLEAARAIVATINQEEPA